MKTKQQYSLRYCNEDERQGAQKPPLGAGSVYFGLVMLKGVEPTELKPPVDFYFKLFRKSLDLSKVRSESGRKGGKAKKKTEDKPLSFADFLARNPQIKDDVYSERLKEGIDWTALNRAIHKSEEWKSETSLYRIISNKNAVIGA